MHRSVFCSLVVVFPACGEVAGHPYEYDGAQPDDGIFTIAILPDTQGYSKFYPEIWQEQTQWLAAHRHRLNLQPVIHLGDLVEASWRAEQWQVADDAMRILDAENAPYLIAPGNHDYGETYDVRNAGDRTTLLHHYFPRMRFERMASFQEFYPEELRVDNSVHTFAVAGQSWLLLALEFGPRDVVLDWANAVVASHPDHRVIVATHAYLYSDDSRYDIGRTDQEWNPHSYGVGGSAEGVNDGQEMWDKFISKHANIDIVISGHVLNDGLGYAVSQGAGTVHEMLVNYQMNAYAGAGYLRMLHIDTKTRYVLVRTYSPWAGESKMDEANHFEFRLQ